ncbi:BAG domain-containing protein Samui-like [Panonychus citri]|uniref:BAG domain-containing protein Samui-like n=1 Tax=Panonychus citri TaxID=50023 RepID=UPI0023076D3D|nr:BAG domain-containing protein Samui-like [Panonychus citri]
MNNHQSNQPRERSIPITTTQDNMPTTTHFPLSSSSSHPMSSSGPFSSSPGRGNLFNQLNQFRKNHSPDELFSDRSHFSSPFGSMSSGSRNVGDFFSSHGNNDEEDCEQQESHQPRVYNIPIQVETPEGVVPLSRSNSHSPSFSQFRNNSHHHHHHAAPTHGGGPIPDRTGETFTRQRPGPSPTPPPKPRFTPSYKPEPQGYTFQQQYQPDAHPQTHRVHNIPVQVEKTSKPSESVSNQSHFKQDVPNIGRDSPRPESQQSGNGGPHVINIPVNAERSQSSENKSQPQPQPQPHQPAPNQSKASSEPQKGPVDPLDLIKSIKDEACRLESEVNNFDGESQKQYRYLDEMLTRCMLKLDNIDSGGRDEVRSARKSTLAYVDRVIAILENKVNRPGTNQEVPETIESNMEQQSGETESSMEAETGEIDSTSQQQQQQQSTDEKNDPELTGNVDNNEMEVESGSGQSNETTEQPDEQLDEDVADGETIEEEEEEDPSGVDGQSKDLYNCSYNQLSNENICRTTEAVIVEEMDKEEPPEEPPTKINRSSEQHDEKVNIELNLPLGQGQFQGDGIELINSSQPKIELPPEDSMGSDESLDTLKENKVSIISDSDNSNASDDILDIEPFVEMPDESSVSSKDSDENNRQSLQIVEESSNANMQSSPPKPVHA